MTMPNTRLPRLLLALLLAAAAAACDNAPPRPRGVQTVKLLPDTAPPPPPKIEEKRPEPKPEEKPQPQITPPKPVDAPAQPQALKTDEQPGSGAGGGLVAGEVKQDYVDQKIGAATISGTIGREVGVDRLALNSFASATTRAINEFLARERELKRLDYRVNVNVWLRPGGALQRAELDGSTGDAETDAALRAALGRFPGVSQPLPDRLPQPIRLQVSNRMIG
jgi:protein TonB